MRGICQEAKSCGMLLEYNLLGLRVGREYPVPIFWEMAAEEGCTAVLGVDAHDPQSLNDLQTEQQAREFLKTVGIALEENPNLVKI
jgi:histidinol-phosphatase (PHP family)